VLVCFNKIDLAGVPVRNALGVSALTGEGIESLLTAVIRRLIPHPPQSGEAVPLPTGI
jgi:translation elongation factor EF-4